MRGSLRLYDKTEVKPMLNIVSELSGNEVEIHVDGKMDTNTAQQVTEEINNHIENVDKVILDLEKLTYISSAGLRVFVLANQQLNDKGGELNVRNVPQSIMDIFEMTGFSGVLKII